MACFGFFLMITACDHQKMKPDGSLPSKDQPSDTMNDSNYGDTHPNVTENNAVAGQVLIKFKEGSDVESMHRIQRAFHLKPMKVVTEPNLYLMSILDGTPVEQKIQALKGAEEVEYAEPNVVYSLD